MAFKPISRRAWSPEPKRCQPTRRDVEGITELFIHWPGALPTSWQHVTTAGKEHDAIRGIQVSHMNRPDDPFCDIGYSHVIVPNWGRPGKPAHCYRARGGQFIPAAQLGHNTSTIAVCLLVGPNDPLTDATRACVRAYVRFVQDKVGHAVRIRGHGEVTATECPGPKLRAFIRELKR